MCTLTKFSLKWLSETQKRQFIQKISVRIIIVLKRISVCVHVPLDCVATELWKMFSCVSVFGSNLLSNPYVCDCHLAWLGQWLKKTRVVSGNPRCQKPAFLKEIPIQDVATPDFTCDGELRMALIQPNFAKAATKKKKMSIFRILCRIISCIIKQWNKSLSTPHQAFWFKPAMTTVGLSRFSASPVSYFCRRPRQVHPQSPIASVLGHTHSHPRKGLVRTARSVSVKQQPQMTSACGF